MARIVIDSERCKGCKLCIPVCPKGLVEIGKNFNAKGYFYATQRNPEQCTGCKLCAIMCPDSAISVYKEANNS